MFRIDELAPSQAFQHGLVVVEDIPCSEGFTDDSGQHFNCHKPIGHLGLHVDRDENASWHKGNNHG